MNIVTGEGRQGTILAALLLGLSLVAASWIWSSHFVAAKTAGEGLTVKGYAEMSASSVTAVWRGSLMARSADLAEATREMDRQAAVMSAWLESRGVKADEWEWLPITSYTFYRNEANGTPTAQIEAYQLERPLKIRSTRVQEVARLARETEGLLRQNVAWNAQPPEYYLGELEAVKLELLGKATADARKRAEVLVGNRKRLGPLINAKQGILQVTPQHSAEMEDFGMYSTETIEKTVKAVVTATFTLKP